MKTRWYKSLLSMMLILALCIQLIPAQVWASVLDTVGNVSAETSTADEPVTVVGEEESMRTESGKHFRLSDGSFIAVSYGMPVHYQDASGNWEDIDNTLSLSTDQSVYTATNELFATSFAADLSTGQVLTSYYNGVSVSMSLMDESEAQMLVANGVATIQASTTTSYNRSSTAAIISDADEMVAAVMSLSDGGSSNGEGWTTEDLIPETLASSVLYENVYMGVDLLYTAYGYDIKEQIIVNTKQSEYRFDFFIETVGLTAVLNEDDSITMADSVGKVIYSIPAPYMTDSAGAASDAVAYTLTQVSGGYVLTVTADATWINSDDRVLPVAIDPTLTHDASTSNDGLFCTYVREGAPDTSHPRYQEMYFGYSSSSKESRVFMHLAALPEIPADSIVTDAILGMYLYNYSRVTCNNLPTAIYEVTEDRPSDDVEYSEWIHKLTWDTQPEYDTNNAIDYVNIKQQMGGSYLHWDITEAIKKWYETGTSNRTLAMAITEGKQAWSSSYAVVACLLAYGSTHPPIIAVAYRNNTGIESYYTYATLGGGESGTAYIADASGQLKIAKGLVSYASTVNPFALSLVYNSDYFTYAPDNNYQPAEELGLTMRLGAGWKLSVIQKAESVTIGGTAYIKYTDGDGTVHYFADDPDDDADIYYDEDGLGLEINIEDNGNYTMTDGQGNTCTFVNSYLTNIADESGNQYLINYTDGKITTIQQQNNGCAAITVATFAYSGNYVSTVTDAAGTVYALGYTDGKLVSITHGSTQIAAYTYENNRVVSMTDSQCSYSIVYTYDDAGKISHYHEVGSTGTTGAQVDVTYDGYDKTTYRDYGADRSSNTADDILTHYLFDYAGRTVNAYSTDNNHNIIGASNAVYTEANATNNYKDNNRILKSASIGMAAEQLLLNSGFETADRWTLTNFTSTNANPRTGNYALRASLSSITTRATATAQTPFLQMNQTYTLSAYVNTSDLEFSGQNGVWICASFNGSVWESDYLSYSTAEAVENGWTRISVTFTAPTTGIYTVGVVAQGVIGTLFVDDLQLECGEAPSNRNMLENGDFTISDYAWTFGSNGTQQLIDTRFDPDYVNAQTTIAKTWVATISSTAFDTAANVSQIVNVNLPATKTYVLSGWAKGNSVPDDSLTTGQEVVKQFGLRAVVTYEDDTTQIFYAPFNADLTDWQYTSLTIVPDSKTHTVVKSITVYCTYEQNLNSVSFDNISLVQQVAQAMEYNTDGTLKESQTSGINENTYTYDENGNLKTSTNSAGSTTTYFYADTNHLHRLTSYTNTLITSSFTYDAQGNVLTSVLKDNGETLQMVSSSVYTNSGNLVSGTTNVNGITTSYAYSTDQNKMLGLPSAVTDANGTVTSILYDNFGRTTQTSVANSATLVYNYSNGNLASIARTAGGVTQYYYFTYDGFGNVTRIRAGSRSLAAYEYASGNGALLKQTFANGDTVTFTYDNLGRLKMETLDDGRVVTYTYNGEGQLYSVTETGGDSPAAYYYTYDANGRLVSSEKRDTDGESLMRVHLYYDEAGQLVGQVWNIGGTEYTEGYTYNAADGTLNTLTTAGQTLTMGYDALRRLRSVSSALYTKVYTYKSLTDSTTSQVSTLQYYYLPATTYFGYNYDSLGNIVTYRDVDGDVVRYTYDAQGQLLTATGTSSGTYTYTYDNAGNVLTANGHTYTYGNAQWRDLLTAYDGESITYDGSGNPLSYYNGTRWTFTWENGRSLATATDGATSISYAYDASGLRTSKTVDGVTHCYYYASGKLLRETYGSNVLDFFYDQNGQPFAFSYNGVRYYYITNLQGDVEYIIDGNKNIVGAYKYDPYGNIIAGGTTAIAVINPLRYRGYYFDTDSGFYYLQSRYYDPATCRFINADVYTSTGQGILGNNMFAYCGNHPVARVDSSGKFFFTVLGAIVGAISGAIDSLAMGGTPEEIATSAFAGAVSGAISGAGVDIGVAVTAATGGAGVGVGVAIAGVMGAAGAAVGTGISTNWKADPMDYAASALVGGMTNMISFGLAPINGEIGKGALTIVKGIVNEGIKDLAMNIATGGVIAAGATWVTRVITNNNQLTREQVALG